MTWEASGGGGTSGCSVGFVAERSGVTGFVTASHCSSSKWSSDSSIARNAPSYRAIGFESIDPTGYSCGLLTCRGSDAGFWKFYGGILALKGLLARVDTIGSLTWNQTDPYLIISAAGSAIYEGLGISKLGATSGLRTGTITDTCDDYSDGWTVDTCQSDATAYTLDGDSGGPVYWFNGDAPGTVTLAGTQVAKTGSHTLIFSSFARIATNLGISSSDVIRAPALSTPSLTGSLTSGHARVDWSAVSGASQYEVYVFDVYQNCIDDWGCFPYGYAEQHHTVYTNYYVDSRDTFTAILAPTDPHFLYSEIRVVATNPGAQNFSLSSGKITFERYDP